MANNNSRDIFNREIGQKVFAFTADQLTMTYSTDEQATGTALADGGSTTPGFYLTRLQVSYEQSVTVVHELGSNRRAFVAGRPSGTGTLDHLLGPVGLSKALLGTLGNVCNVGHNYLNFTFSGDCEGVKDVGDDSAIQLKWVCATQMSLGMDNSTFQLTDSLSIMYAYLRDIKTT